MEYLLIQLFLQSISQATPVTKKSHTDERNRKVLIQLSTPFQVDF